MKTNRQWLAVLMVFGMLVLTIIAMSMVPSTTPTTTPEAPAMGSKIGPTYGVVIEIASSEGVRIETFAGPYPDGRLVFGLSLRGGVFSILPSGEVETPPEASCRDFSEPEPRRECRGRGYTLVITWPGPKPVPMPVPVP